MIFASTVLVGTVSGKPIERIPVIVGFKDLPDAALVHAHGGQIIYQYSLIPAIACRLPVHAIGALQKNPKVAYIEADMQVFASDAELDNSWGVKRIGSGTVHDSGNEGAGIKVAVIDTGINYLHEELSSVFKGGWDFVNNDADPMDDNGHGTHCAGIIAAADNNQIVVGVAPQASLYAVKVLNSAGSGSTSTVIAGIQWAVQNGMQVISMSLGASSGTTSLKQACDNAYNQGVILVAASGNDYKSVISYPARYSSVIAVGATDSQDVRAIFSNYGTGLELMAPGVSILSTYIDVTSNDGRNIDVVYMSGTSMACPHVAGAAALALASPVDSQFDSDHDGVWDASEVRAKLQATADDLGASGWDQYYGYGLVDADEAAIPTVADTTPPTISELTPEDGSTVYVANPFVSAKLTDASGVNSTSVTMKIDGSAVSSTYNSQSGLVTFDPSSLSDGSHTVDLSVKDMKGNLAARSWTFSVDTSRKWHVESIVMALVTAGSNTYATATVKVVDSNSSPLLGSAVIGEWLVAGKSFVSSGVTVANGMVTLQSDNVENAEAGMTFTVKVSTVVLDGYNLDWISSVMTNSIMK
jgi:subtilisin